MNDTPEDPLRLFRDAANAQFGPPDPDDTFAPPVLAENRMPGFVTVTDEWLRDAGAALDQQEDQ